MKKVFIYLEYLFDWIFLLLLYAVSLVTVLPFTTFFATSVAYFDRRLDSRSLKVMWTSFRENQKLYLQFGLVTTLFIGVSVLNIRVLQYTPGVWTNLIHGLSWISLMFGFFLLLFAPILILKMNLTFRQLLQNTILLMIRGNVMSVLLIFVGAGLFIAGLYYPFMLAPFMFIIAYVDLVVARTIFNKMKRES